MQENLFPLALLLLFEVEENTISQVKEQLSLTCRANKISDPNHGDRISE